MIYKKNSGLPLKVSAINYSLIYKYSKVGNYKQHLKNEEKNIPQ